MKHIKSVLPGIFLYLLSTGASYATFSYITKTPQTDSDSPQLTASSSGLVIDPNEPKTEICPLNGQMYTKTEKDVWETRRPIAIMINNHVEARPQSGITTADITYEAVAEGGITRFMGLFYCDAVSEDIIVAPVRSARTYFVDWASEYNFPMYVHAGGANCSADKYPNGTFGPCKTDKRAQAIEQISSYGWNMQNDVTSMSLGRPVFVFNNNRFGPDRQLAKEHTLTTTTEAIWKLAKERDMTNTDPEGNEWIDDFTLWSFKDSGPVSSDVTQISYSFWRDNADFRAKWTFNPDTNLYSRFTGEEPHTDLNNDEQVAVTNLVILFTKETVGIDDLGHLLYTTTGKGDALIFQDGKVIEGNWSKLNRTARTKFTDSSGKEIQFTRGKIWISVLDNSADVNY